MIIAIDGPAGSGKSTTARAVARRLDYMHLDTGAMYRAVALAFLNAGSEPSAEQGKIILPELKIDIGHSASGMQIQLNGKDVSKEIRAPEVGQMASLVGQLPAVRSKLVAEQQRIGHAQSLENGVVLEGRDIGTVVFPDADLKIFMVASVATRAQRRRTELLAKGDDVSMEEVLEEISRRDHQDSTRSLSPLRKAEDAVELDTTRLTFEEQVHFILELARERAT